MHIFTHRRRASQTIYIYHPSLVSATLLVVGQARRLVLLFGSWQDWHDWILRLNFCFKRCILTPWIFACAGFSDVSDLENRLRGPLRSWGSFYFSMFLTFLEGFLKCSGTLSNCSRASWLLCPIRYLRWSLILSLGIWVSYRSSGGTSFWGLLLFSQFPHDEKGAPEFLKALLYSVLGNLLPDLFVL